MTSENNPQDKQHEHHLLEAGIGAAGGSVAGAALGKLIGGNKAGTVVGAVAGAVAGGIIGDAVSDDIEELERKAMETLGEAKGENQVPAHYSWDELAALSSPQNT